MASQSKGDVLIVDDDPAICSILKEYCQSMACFRNILTVHDGAMAASKLRNQKFGLVLLDLKIPKKSGLDLLRELDDKSINSKNIFIIVTGELDKTIMEKIIVTGVKNFLLKPFTEADFKSKVQGLLNIKS